MVKSSPPIRISTLEEPKITQEQVGTRIIHPANRPDIDILVDDDYDGEYLATHFYWYYNTITGYISGGYKSVDLQRGHDRRGLYLHHVVAGPPTAGMAGLERYHINGDRMDNRTTNIGWRTHQQNTRERKQAIVRKRKPDSKYYAPYRGVALAKGRYYVAIFQQHVLGSFATAEEAAEAYDEMAYATFGKKARLNFPRAYGLDEPDDLRPVQPM